MRYWLTWTLKRPSWNWPSQVLANGRHESGAQFSPNSSNEPESNFRSLGVIASSSKVVLAFSGRECVDALGDGI